MSRSVNSLRPAVATTTEVAFNEVVQPTQAARQRVARAANAEVTELYWRIGQ